jgi:regulatory protein
VSSDRLIAIETAGPKRRGRRIVFETGESITTSKRVVTSLGLSRNQQLSLAELTRLIAEIEPQHLRDRALWLLSYRDRSRVELQRELINDGYCEPLVQVVIERFAQLSLMDDARFAASYARTRLRSGRGRRGIERDLLDRGVAPDTVLDALNALSDEDELSRARAVIGDAPFVDRRDRERRLRRLIARGFEMRIALEAVNSLQVD